MDLSADLTTINASLQAEGVGFGLNSGGNVSICVAPFRVEPLKANNGPRG